MDKPTKDPASIGEVDIEAFSHNLARMVEEGGKALAAYLKPREQGEISGDLSEDVTDAVKSLGRVAEYWLSDPRRALEVQTSLGRAYLDLSLNPIRKTNALPIQNGRKTSFSIS
jgi:polyhydroxyalkanoate synthase